MILWSPSGLSVFIWPFEANLVLANLLILVRNDNEETMHSSFNSYYFYDKLFLRDPRLDSTVVTCVMLL